MANAHRAEPAPRRRTPRTAAATGDAELIALVRAGDAAASGELWRRHAPAARSVARAWSSLDADDLVSEAFLRTLDAIAKGGGPEGAFRPYLFTAVRNAASTWGRRGTREQPLEDGDDLAAEDDGPEELALAALDRDLGVRAFRALPARWQEVLWYTAVEGMTPAQAAPLLGLRPNGVAALGHRAREGLRGAWIQQHISATDADGECHWVLQQAGAHVRGRLPLRERRRADAHLGECASCRSALAEAEGANARLAVVLLPIVAGVAGAAAYAGSGAGGGAVSTGAATIGTTAGSTGGAAGSASAAAPVVSAPLVAAIAVAAVVVVAGIAVAGLLPQSPGAPAQEVAAPAGPATQAPPAPDDDPAPEPAPTALLPTAPPPAAAPRPTDAPTARRAVPTPTTAPPPTPTPVGPPTPPAPPAPVPSTVPATTAAPTAPTDAPPTTPAPTAPATPAPTPTAPTTPAPTPTAPATPAAPEAPTLLVEEDPAHRLLPDARGTATPGSRVTVEDPATGVVYAAVRVSADGTWETPALPLPAGETVLVARGALRSAPWTVRLEAPLPLAGAPAVPGEPVEVVVLADSGLVDVLIDGTVVRTAAAVAPGFAFSLGLSAGEHVIAARYASADGRFGAEAATRIVVR